jgi:hypothetical protein
VELRLQSTTRVQAEFSTQTRLALEARLAELGWRRGP